MNELGFFEGFPIYIATNEYQPRKHHKKRINKKWRKRYGVIENNLMPHGQIIFNEFNGALYMTKKTFEETKKRLEERDKYGRYRVGN